MVQALNTGHAGSMSTVHARDPGAAMARIESLAAMAPEGVPHAALARLVDNAFDLVVMVERRDGRRRVSGIHDVERIVR